MKRNYISTLLAGILGLASAGCGGDKETPEPGDAAGGAEAAAPEKVDAVAVVKKTAFPRGEAGDLPDGITWGELLEKTSDSAPGWEEIDLPESIPDAAGHSGVISRIEFQGGKIWVLFKVAKDGAVTAAQVGEGDDETPQTEDAEEIVGGLGKLYGLKSGDPSVIGAMRAKAIETKNINLLKQYALGLNLYASQNGGVFPESLDILVDAGIPEEKLTVTEPGSGKEGREPIYFPGLNNTTKAETIVLACPFVNPDGKRTVAYVDGSVESILDVAYKLQIEAREK